MVELDRGVVRGTIPGLMGGKRYLSSLRARTQDLTWLTARQKLSSQTAEAQGSVGYSPKRAAIPPKRGHGDLGDLSLP